MNHKCNAFRRLHHGERPFLVANAWDAASAKLFETAGAQTVATSSAALAWSLGYPDGSALPRAELIGAVKRISRVVDVPITIDIEDGYSGEPGEVVDLVSALVECGVVGINIEDGLDDPRVLSAKLEAIRRKHSSNDIFLNARTDVYLRQLAAGQAAVDMTIVRLAEYRRAGADGAFVPGLRALDEVSAIAKGCELPLNLMALPKMESVENLFRAGMRRLSVGPALFGHAYAVARELATNFIAERQVEAMFGQTISFAEINEHFRQRIV
jgi:2-methylisocitrate lyase-like PEP mutase family enzyme